MPAFCVFILISVVLMLEGTVIDIAYSKFMCSLPSHRIAKQRPSLREAIRQPYGVITMAFITAQ